MNTYKIFSLLLLCTVYVNGEWKRPTKEIIHHDFINIQNDQDEDDQDEEEVPTISYDQLPQFIADNAANPEAFYDLTISINDEFYRAPLAAIYNNDVAILNQLYDIFHNHADQQDLLEFFFGDAVSLHDGESIVKIAMQKNAIDALTWLKGKFPEDIYQEVRDSEGVFIDQDELQEAGRQADEITNDEYHPFLWAVLYGNIEAMKLLKPKEDENGKVIPVDGQDRSPLSIILCSEYIVVNPQGTQEDKIAERRDKITACVQWLLQEELVSLDEDMYGHTALYYAEINDHAEIVDEVREYFEQHQEANQEAINDQDDADGENDDDQDDDQDIHPSKRHKE